MTKAKAATAPAFTFDEDLPIPASTRGASEDVEKLLAMKVGQSFLDPITVPETIVAPAEREQHLKDQSKRIMQRSSNLRRRLAKVHPDHIATFESRRVDDKTLGTGVRTWRTS